MAVKKLVYFVPVLICLIAVFGLSSQSYHQQTIIPFLERHISMERLAGLLPDIKIHYGHQLLWSKAMPYPFVEFVFRKFAHVFSYTVLGCCLFFAFRAFEALTKRLQLRLLAMAAGLAIVAPLDEWNQTGVYMRTGQTVDVWLDIIGGTIGAAILVLSAEAFAIIRGRRNLKGEGIP